MHKEVLLGCAPLLKENDFSADHYLEYIDETLRAYKTSISNIVCVMEDRCVTNRRLYDISDVSLVGCYFHKFNLALESCIETKNGLSSALNVFRDVMYQSRNPARFRELTHVEAILPKKLAERVIFTCSEDI